ncbi:MAG TPA: WD40 repeat domain-containing protein [Pyrinomonadaceae bacterium]|nr:WD40 repeat domain-containing protein [Pyrinomonadaceae bacterium]
MKRFDESVPQQLGEILIKHGRSPLADAKLCENLLKDYCPEHKEEIALLALAVRERIASDLLLSQDGLHRDLLRSLLVKRLRKTQSLSEGDARWAVESWAIAIRAFARSEDSPEPKEPSPVIAVNPSNPWSTSGLIGQTSKPVRVVVVSPLDNSIVSGGDDNQICLWRDGRTVLAQCEDPVSALAFAPNGAMLALASGSEVHLFDVQSREATFRGQVGKQPSLVFSPGGKSLATTGIDSPCEIQVWNLQTGATRLLKGAWKGPASISFSPDGNTIVAADSDRSNASIRIWDLETGTARVLGQSTRQITSVAFLPDGKRIASGSWDETVRVWNIRTGEARTLGENCSCIVRLAVSNKGDRIAASSLDGRLRVWDVDTGRSRIAGQCYSVNALTFTTDDQSLVTGSDDGSIRLWNTTH